MALQSGWPSITDDMGDGVSGTEIEKATFDAVKSSIEDQTHSIINSGQKPWQTTDEVIAARGNKPNLDARISGAIDDDGNLLVAAEVVTESELLSALGNTNLCRNDTFTIWAGEADGAPAYFVRTAGAGVIAQTGTGLTDTTRKVGDFAMSVTGAATVLQTPLSGTSFVRSEHIKGLTCQVGGFIKTSSLGHARLTIDDGALVTISNFHNGDGTFRYITSPVHTISQSATKVSFGVEVLGPGTAHFSALNFAIDNSLPLRHRNSLKSYGSLYFPFKGVPIVETGRAFFIFQRPTLIKSVQAYSRTAPGAGGLIIDVLKGDGGSPGTFTSIFSVPPVVIASGNRFGATAPSSAYVNRCFRGSAPNAVALSAGNVLRLDLNGVNGAADGFIQVRCMQYPNVLEDMLADGDANL